VARDLQGQRISAHVKIYEQMLRSFYDNTMALYLEQYGLFGDPEVLPLKIFWDYTFYWGVLAQLFFHDGLTELGALQNLRDELVHVQQLNQSMQRFLRELSSFSRKRNHAILLDQASLPWFVALNASLADQLGPAGLPPKAAGFEPAAARTGHADPAPCRSGVCWRRQPGIAASHAAAGQRLRPPHPGLSA
jgi:hypothetical protein